MPSLPDDALDARFKALADHNRRTIVLLVLARPGITVQEICAAFATSRFAVMNHLNILERAGIITSEKDSIYRRFAVVETAMDELWESWKQTTSDARNRKGGT